MIISGLFEPDPGHGPDENGQQFSHARGDVDTMQIGMAALRQLTRPPIVEALVDIRIAADERITRARLEPLGVELRKTYPRVDERRMVMAEFRVETGKLIPPSSRDLGFQGIWLTSEDGRRTAQFRTDGFTLNNVGEYLGGDALIAEALDLWRRFAAVTEPTAVMRCALRYINRLELPFVEGDEFTRFLVAAPSLPENAPQDISNFLSRVVAHDDSGATAIVTQKLDSRQQRRVPVILDIDVFFSRELEPAVDQLRPSLDVLRTLKNRCFFSLITEEAAMLYQ